MIKANPDNLIRIFEENKDKRMDYLFREINNDECFKYWFRYG